VYYLGFILTSSITKDHFSHNYLSAIPYSAWVRADMSAILFKHLSFYLQ